MSDQEAEYCDECGRRLQNWNGRWKCGGCEADYNQGTADYHAYKDALAIGGEELAMQMEMEAEYGFLG